MPNLIKVDDQQQIIDWINATKKQSKAKQNEKVVAFIERLVWTFYGTSKS